MNKNIQNRHYGNNNHGRSSNRTYNNVKASIRSRNQAQKEMKNLWDKVKRDRGDHRTEMNKITRRIGQATERINRGIEELSRSKSHKRQALSLINNEERRLQKIKQSNNRLINDTKNHRCRLISDRGRSDYDTKSTENYVKKLNKKINAFKQLRSRIK